jgi:DNA-binding beta-propeller fold protein YncE
MNRCIALAVVVIITALLPKSMSLGADAQPEQPKYHISKVVPLGLPDRWDYVVFDPESHRVYIAHGDGVTVVDGLGGAIIGTVEGMPGGTHGVAISHATGKGYTDDGKTGVAVAFDLQTLKAVKRIKAESDAVNAGAKMHRLAGAKIHQASSLGRIIRRGIGTGRA